MRDFLGKCRGRFHRLCLNCLGVAQEAIVESKKGNPLAGPKRKNLNELFNLLPKKAGNGAGGVNFG